MRIGALLVLTLGLSGCSPPAARIHAETRGNDIVFTATMSSGPLPFMRHVVDLQPDLIRVDHGGKIVWRIERRRDRPCLNYGGGGPSAVFPLTYGRVPACFTETVRPQHLIAGISYRIAAVGGGRHDKGLGFFRTGLTVQTLDSEPAGLENWGEVETIYNVAATPGPANEASPPPR